jgi:flagellar hook-length control protein FliK
MPGSQPPLSDAVPPDTAERAPGPAPSPLAAASADDRDRGESTRHHPFPTLEQKDTITPAPVLAAPRVPAVDSQPDSKAAAAAAGSTRPGGAEVVTLPTLPARLAQLAAGLPDRGSIGVRLRLDPPSLGEIRFHVESSARGIEVRIVTQSHEACALLSEGQRQLTQELGRHGLALHSFAASVGGDGADDPLARQHKNQHGKQAMRSGHRQPAADSPKPAADTRGLAEARRLDRRV